MIGLREDGRRFGEGCHGEGWSGQGKGVSGKGVRNPFFPYRLSLNQSQGKEEIENIPYALKRSRPNGSEQWVSKAVTQSGLETTIRNSWRPGKGS